ncbi:MAG: N-6 DNA methylase [Ignavibacterium sp.]|nr:N-6 DNA methylase [Ignavibacterium sp.]MDW8375180.1 type ISP restriction/modification enzyme [Ignavibacteriales bacterium]
MINEYLQNIFNTFQQGDAREESYYKHLANLINEISQKKRNKKIEITILPKKTDVGNPDFRIWDGKQKIVGYIEAKDLGTDLDKIEDSEQIKRYLSTFPNLILTNFTEFRFYRDNTKVANVSIARHYVIKKLSSIPPAENEEKFFELIERFLDFSLPKTYTAKSLAIELAKRTKFLKDEIISEELKIGTKSIRSFYDVFNEYLIAGISEEEFADLYSQTITYGLFAARLRANDEFNRKLAYSFIPKSIGILRDIFKFISLEDLPPQLELIIDDIAEVLSVADAKKLLDEYYHNGKGNDPVLHFYETFLSVYDPDTREKRGVYYTPEPVVSYIVRSIDEILKDKFKLYGGLTSSQVTLLDPAGGTLGFLAKAIELAVTYAKERIGAGAIDLCIRDVILKNFHAFELMMAPYAIGHMKISFLLDEYGYKMQDNERVKYYLTNSLDMKELEQSKFPGMSSLSNESHEAGKIKKEVPILVILGNPPYSGHSANTGEWISEEIKEYYHIEGIPIKEKNPKWLQDDYVKFIRFAQWKIEKAGEGVIGFITNHSYLDNPTFRAMRYSLMKSFDEIYILDLHGNSLKKEKAPDGSKDENVFDIQQGVAIAFFIKYRNKRKTQVFHHEIFGLRESKYEWLNKHNIKNTKWNRIYPGSEFYLFIPTDNKLANQYNSFEKITDIFPVYSVGVVTARDNFVIDFDKKRLINRIRDFVNPRIDDEILKRTYDLNENQSWKIKVQREKLRQDFNWKDSITKILYRPFDERWILYHDEMIERPRREVMQHMFNKNLSLLISRQLDKSGNLPIFISEQISEGHCITSAVSITYQLPLYLYHKSEEKDKKKKSSYQIFLFEPEVSYAAKVPNFRYGLLEDLTKVYKKEIKPEEVLYYIYAILYSNKYRTKYADFLKIDFPRIPFTKRYKIFSTLCSIGEELSNLHLLKFDLPKKFKATFPVKSSNKVEKIKYELIKNNYGRVWINNEQYFDRIEQDIWNYHVGGYQICEKWLKDRKEQILQWDDIEIYYKIIEAISKTIKLQNEIDEIFDKVESNLLSF